MFSPSIFSVDGRNHPSRDWIKADWANKCHLVDTDTRVVGENLYAVHSITYGYLESYFYGLSVWHNGYCTDVDETVRTLDRVGYPYPRVLYRGTYDRKIIEKLYDEELNPESEGYVVRLVGGFFYDNFAMSVAKFVRKDHVKTDKHWMHSPIERNRLRKNT